MTIAFDDLEILRPYKRPKPRVSRRDWYRLLGKIADSSKNDCLLWIAAQTKGGYGVINLNDKQVRATRLIYEIFYDADIPADIEVCHTCDTPSCINPDHLWLGTRKENAEDKMKKGRWRGGVKKGYYAGAANPKAKLDHKKVAIIKDQHGISSAADLAKQLGVTRETIYNIWNGKTWR